MPASDFTPDLSKLDFAALADHLAGIAKLVAATTPSPLDDIAAGYLGTVLADLLKSRLTFARSGVMMAASPEQDADLVTGMLAAKGVTVSRPLLEKILQLALQLIPLFL